MQRLAWIGGIGLAMAVGACGGDADPAECAELGDCWNGPVPSACRQLAPGESEVVLDWSSPGASVQFAGVAPGLACDQFVVGAVAGRLEVEGQTLENATFLLRRDALGQIAWLKYWPLLEVSYFNVAPAPDGSVWVVGESNAPTDLGDGILHPTGEGASVLARYRADGSLAALLVGADESAVRLASNVDSRLAALQILNDEDQSARLHVFNEEAESIWELPLPMQGELASAIPAPDGSIFAVTAALPAFSSRVERYDPLGALWWSTYAPGQVITSLAVLPAGGLALGGSYCSTNDAIPNTCDGGEFVRSIEDSGSTRFDVPHDLGQMARVVPSVAGDVLLVGEDPSAHRLALQRVNFNGTFGTRDVFMEPPAPPGYFQPAVSGSTLWIAGGYWVGTDPTPVSITDNGFLLEAGL